MLTKDERQLKNDLEEMLKLLPKIIAHGEIDGMRAEHVGAMVPVTDLQKIISLALETLLMRETTP